MWIDGLAGGAIPRPNTISVNTALRACSDVMAPRGVEKCCVNQWLKIVANGR